MSGFRPIGDLAPEAVEAALAGTAAGDLLGWLRAHGGVRTRAEIEAEGFDAADLRRCEAAGLVHRRDMMGEAGDVAVWWAPRVPLRMPWQERVA